MLMLSAEAASAALLLEDTATLFAALPFADAVFPAGEALLTTEAATLLTTEAFTAMLMLSSEATSAALLLGVTAALLAALLFADAAFPGAVVLSS